VGARGSGKNVTQSVRKKKGCTAREKRHTKKGGVWRPRSCLTCGGKIHFGAALGGVQEGSRKKKVVAETRFGGYPKGRTRGWGLRHFVNRRSILKKKEMVALQGH